MTNISDYDVTIILGNGVYSSKRRANHAAKLIKDLDTPIIVTGGIPITIPFLQNPNGLTEAEIMQRVLEEKGISTKRIYQEPTAQRTIHNFERSEGLLKKLGASSIAVVTEIAHMPRALNLAQKTFPDYKIKGFSTPITEGNIIGNLTMEGIIYFGGKSEKLRKLFKSN